MNTIERLHHACRDYPENVTNNKIGKSISANEDAKVKFFEVPLKPVYNLVELLKIVPIGRSSIYNEVKAGRLRAAKMGRRTLFLANDISTWLEKMRLS